LIRALALACFVLVAACGDDTTTPAPIQDMSCQCCYSSGEACTTPGASCHAFETFCTCGSDDKWLCHGPQFFDMSQPATD
jgi:hypothetical protein